LDNFREMTFMPATVLKALSEYHSYLALEKKIANANQDGKTIDRRKLRRLVAGAENVSLTVEELKALDAFFTPLGEGLADKPIFAKPAPLRSIAEKGRVTIAIGAYPCKPEERNELNRWDVRAMAVVLQAIEKSRPGTPVGVEDMRFTDGLPRPPPFLDEEGPSVCCIGSPRSCYAAEFMLARMLGVTEFSEASVDHVPFRFIWSPKATRPYPSAFRAEAEQICALDNQLAADIKADRAWGALEIRDMLYPVRRQNKKGRIWTAHGIVLSQTRPGGQAWMVIAGMSGPATFACAAIVAADRAGAVPTLQTGQGSIRWDVVECTVQGDGDQQDVTSQRVVNCGWFSGDDRSTA
jgi:hypothetical protein